MQILSCKFYKIISSFLIYLKYPVNSISSDIINLIVLLTWKEIELLKDPVKIVHLVNVFVLLFLCYNLYMNKM